MIRGVMVQGQGAAIPCPWLSPLPGRVPCPALRRGARGCSHPRPRRQLSSRGLRRVPPVAGRHSYVALRTPLPLPPPLMKASLYLRASCALSRGRAGRDSPLERRVTPVPSRHPRSALGASLQLRLSVSPAPRTPTRTRHGTIPTPKPTRTRTLNLASTYASRRGRRRRRRRGRAPSLWLPRRRCRRVEHLSPPSPPPLSRARRCFRSGRSCSIGGGQPRPARPTTDSAACAPARACARRARAKGVR